MFFKCFGSRNAADRSHENLWRLFSLKELQAATNNFNYDNKLGEGGFGSVYWGQLWDGSQIAVKRLKVWSFKAEMEFAVEIEILGRIRHKYLLGLRGYCVEGKERLIVYTFMHNSSLAAHLHGQFALESQLDWEKRMQIAIGCAEGLSYLHNQATPTIIHRNFKSSNVLLNSEFGAAVADFGFARLIPDGVAMQGKGIYQTPEYSENLQCTEKYDVYSYGVVLVELVSGRKPLGIVEWMMPLMSQGMLHQIADPNLNGLYDEVELKHVLQVAQLCLHSNPYDRPTMLKVVELLKKVRDLDV